MRNLDFFNASNECTYDAVMARAFSAQAVCSWQVRSEQSVCRDYYLVF